jgi:hypothetical protein
VQSYGILSTENEINLSKNFGFKIINLADKLRNISLESKSGTSSFAGFCLAKSVKYVV